MDNFCKNCGARINKNSHFCRSCGSNLDICITPRQSYSKHAKIKTNKILGKVSLIILAIILIFIGTGYMALSVMGKNTTAKIIKSEQVNILANDSASINSARYKLSYEFEANGKHYKGSVTRIFENGSQTNPSIKVLYLSFWPHINTEDRGYELIIGLLLILASGFMLFISLKKRN